MCLHEGARLREPVPGTNRQAFVASINTVAYRRAQFDGDRSFELNREVGNAFARVQLKGRGNSLGRTCGDTASACSAAINLRPVRRQLQRRENFRKKDPVSQSSADEVRVFSYKSQPGSLGEVALENWAGVHVPQ